MRCSFDIPELLRVSDWISPLKRVRVSLLGLRSHALTSTLEDLVGIAAVLSSDNVRVSQDPSRMQLMTLAPARLLVVDREVEHGLPPARDFRASRRHVRGTRRATNANTILVETRELFERAEDFGVERVAAGLRDLRSLSSDASHPLRQMDLDNLERIGIDHPHESGQGRLDLALSHIAEVRNLPTVVVDTLGSDLTAITRPCALESPGETRQLTNLEADDLGKCRPAPADVAATTGVKTDQTDFMPRCLTTNLVAVGLVEVQAGAACGQVTPVRVGEIATHEESEPRFFDLTDQVRLSLKLLCFHRVVLREKLCCCV